MMMKMKSTTTLVLVAIDSKLLRYGIVISVFYSCNTVRYKNEQNWPLLGLHQIIGYRTCHMTMNSIEVNTYSSKLATAKRCSEGLNDELVGRPMISQVIKM